jgi:hypothetical protein
LAFAELRSRSLIGRTHDEEHHAVYGTPDRVIAQNRTIAGRSMDFCSSTSSMPPGVTERGSSVSGDPVAELKTSSKFA